MWLKFIDRLSKITNFTILSSSPALPIWLPTSIFRHWNGQLITILYEDRNPMWRSVPSPSRIFSLKWESMSVCNSFYRNAETIKRPVIWNRPIACWPTKWAPSSNFWLFSPPFCTIFWSVTLLTDFHSLQCLFFASYLYLNWSQHVSRNKSIVKH